MTRRRVTLTLRPSIVEGLDRLRGDQSRSSFTEELLEGALEDLEGLRPIGADENEHER